MRLILQRVKQAHVTIQSKLFSKISSGLLIFVAVGKSDSEKDAQYLVEKVKHLRIFDDDSGKMNLSVADVQGELLIVPQFTLLGDCEGGRRII